MALYELWETRTGNLMASYETEERALHVVSETAQRHGSHSVVSFALVRVDEGGNLETVAIGTDLLDRSRGQTGSSESIAR